jgi:histone deacetylase complex regulatory component SIN3
MDDEEAYDEFLRVLDLFSMDILDADSLLERLSAFLAPDEMDRLLELLGWDEDKAYDENASEDAFERRRALAFLKQTLNAESVTRIGPSYRSCPVVVGRLIPLA